MLVVSGALFLASVGIAAAISGPQAALGLATGGAWNLCSLFCLVHLLRASIGPQRSTRRALGWLLVKFPCLYAAAFVAFRSGSVSVISFGIGFTVVLVSAGACFVAAASRLTVGPAHGR